MNDGQVVAVAVIVVVIAVTVIAAAAIAVVTIECLLHTKNASKYFICTD